MAEENGPPTEESPDRTLDLADAVELVLDDERFNPEGAFRLEVGLLANGEVTYRIINREGEVSSENVIQG